MILVAPPAPTLPQPMTPKALASSWESPIHWCSTVVTTIVVAVLFEVFLGHLLQRAMAPVLNQVAALTVTHCDIPHPCGGQQAFNDGDGGIAGGTRVPSGSKGSPTEMPISSYSPVRRSTYCQSRMVVSRLTLWRRML